MLYVCFEQGGIAMTKYYVEVYSDLIDEPYILQSKWFKTIKQAKEFIEQLDYLDEDFKIDIMKSKFDRDGNYSDIEIAESIR